MNDYLSSVIIGIIEGLTEFLPVSSTAHIRIAQDMLGIDLENEYWKMYAIVIQLGAILSVLVYFRGRIFEFLKTFPKGKNGDRTIWTHPLSLVLLSFVITAGPCLLIDKKIGDNLESLKVIGYALLFGGIVMWVIDTWASRRDGVEPPLPEEIGSTTAPLPAGARLAAAGTAKSRVTWRMDDMSFKQSIVIGAAQILSAAFPGTSRSMSTIAAGQVMGLSRTAALEFSFFLSIPVMFAATGYKMLGTVKKSLDGTLPYTMDGHKWGVLLVGFAVSFFVAWAVIHFFMAWVRKHGFVPFAIYRILIGVVVLAAAYGAFNLNLTQ
jgi:undecaprenyl-diphosphatase